MKKSRKELYLGVGALLSFLLWTILICFVDVQKIGPRESSVGFATFNAFVHNFTKTHLTLYVATDWLGLVPIGIMLCFAFLGLLQWIKRKDIKRVDYDLFVLGGFYIVVFAVYALFEIVTINYRPVLINGFLEKSYPSSTTLLVLCIMPTANMQLNTRLKNKKAKQIVTCANLCFTAFMVLGRLISGVHWITDIVGGILLSFGLVLIYHYVSRLKN